MNGLVIGGGNAGQAYLKAGTKLGHSLTLHERDPRIAQELDASFKNLRVAAEFEELENEFDYIVIASTSDSHLEIARKVVALNPRNLIIEKILTNSLHDLDDLVLLRNSNIEIEFTTHSRWSILRVAERINALIEKYKLGELVDFYSAGGGMCLASGSIHWLSSLYNLFGLHGKNFQLTGNIESITQERRPAFDIIQGEIRFQFGNKLVGFRYNNRARVAPMQVFLFEDGIITLNFSGEYEVFRNNLTESNSRKRYDLGFAREKGNMIGTSANPFELLLISLENGVSQIIDFNNAVRASELIILSMQLTNRAQLNQSDLFKTREKPELYNKFWRIT